MTGFVPESPIFFNLQFSDCYNKMLKSNIKFIPLRNKSVNHDVHVCCVLFIVCLYICVCECLLLNKNHKTKHKNKTISKHHSCVRGPLSVIVKACPCYKKEKKVSPTPCQFQIAANLIRQSDLQSSVFS